MQENNVSPENPLGNWSDLNPKFSTQIKVLFKKHFLVKFRNVASIVEIVFAFFIILISLFPYYFAKYDTSKLRHPQSESITNQSIIDWFMNKGEKAVIVCIPDKPLMHYLIGNTTILKIGIYGGQLPNSSIIFPESIFSYVDSYSKLKSEIFLTRHNAVGFEWTNIDDSNALTNPHIKVYIQSETSSPSVNFYLELKNSIARMRYKIENSTETSLSLSTEIKLIPYAHPKTFTRMSVYSFSYGIIASIAVVIATVPDMEVIFDEKHNRVLCFSFLMGMKETAFWFSNFIVSFIICFVCYLFISLVLSFWFGLVGNSFTMIWVLSIFYIVAEIMFQYFLSTFIYNTRNGRGLTAGLIIASLALGFLFQFATLTNFSKSSSTVIYIFSFFPMAAYELFIMQGSIASNSATMPTYNWKNMNDSEYVCPPWIPFVWLTMDIVAYTLLFFVLNAFLPRPYGRPPLDFKRFFSCKKNKKNKKLNESSTNDGFLTGDVISVEFLNKKFPRQKDSIALEDVCFTIKKGEMIVVIGPNGSGKSTLIGCLTNTIHKTSGKITIYNETRDFRSIGVCYQENVIIKYLTVREHFELFGAYRGVSPNILESSVEYLCSTLNLLNMMDNRAGNLSGGQKRKLCICLSLLGNPRVVMLDEPTAGVDVQGRMLIWKMISRLNDTTSIITSHELEEAETLSSRLFIMTDGKIPFIGTSTELRKQYKCGYVLRIDSLNEDISPVLDLAKSFIPESEISEDRDNVIRIPQSRNIPQFLKVFSERKDELGVKSFTFSIEQLEDVLNNLVYNVQ